MFTLSNSGDRQINRRHFHQALKVNFLGKYCVKAGPYLLDSFHRERRHGQNGLRPLAT
jgi:hypothetical protein